MLGLNDNMMLSKVPGFQIKREIMASELLIYPIFRWFDLFAVVCVVGTYVLLYHSDGFLLFTSQVRSYS